MGLLLDVCMFGCLFVDVSCVFVGRVFFVACCSLVAVCRLMLVVCRVCVGCVLLVVCCFVGQLGVA